MATDHFLNISNKVIKHVNDITRRRDGKYDGKSLCFGIISVGQKRKRFLKHMMHTHMSIII